MTYCINPEKLNAKYIKFLDSIWNDSKFDSWGSCVDALVREFGITPDYADAVVEAYIKV